MGTSTLTKNQLVVACLAALSAFAMTGCGDPKCDPECGAGLACNSEVDPPVCEAVSACNPACAADQTCDTTKNPSVCVTPSPPCSPSCKVTEHCDKSGPAPVCVANTCATECGANQRCDTRTNPGTCVDKGTCDPSCPAGTACIADENTGEQKCDCVGADGTGCTEDQICIKETTPAKCEEICPAVCLPDFESCNHTTKQCEAVTCGTTKCEFGEGCIPFSATDKACSCVPADTNFNDGEDSCASLGLVCEMDIDYPAASHCRKPGPYEDCDPAVGCLEGSDCTKAGNNPPFCLQKCTGLAGCNGIDEECLGGLTGNYASLNNHCYPNFCEDEGETAFKPCYTGAQGETAGSPSTYTGTCFPLGKNGTGYCFQSGTAPSHGQCDPDAGRDNLAGVCPKNQYCDPVEPAAEAGKTLGVCVEVCNAGPPPGAKEQKDCTGSTAAMNSCFDMSGLTGTEYANNARIGFCMSACDPFAADSNCPQDILGNNQACWLGPELNNEGYCKAVTDDAVALGAECEWPSDTDPRDSRSPCQAGFCVGPDDGVSVCQAYCNTVSCPTGSDPENPTLCSTGCDNGEFCFDYWKAAEPNEYLGFCSPAN